MFIKKGKSCGLQCVPDFFFAIVVLVATKYTTAFFYYRPSMNLRRNLCSIWLKLGEISKGSNPATPLRREVNQILRSPSADVVPDRDFFGVFKKFRRRGLHTFYMIPAKI
jgi:hypothetical protein